MAHTDTMQDNHPSEQYPRLRVAKGGEPNTFLYVESLAPAVVVPC